jgi:hypothetical protein
MEKFNLTIIDKNPDIKNFLYPGVSSECVEMVRRTFSEGGKVIEFTYDEGRVMVSSSEIHSIVFSDYVSAEEMEEPQGEEA